ncbi:MAG: archaemetzincin [Bacteroidota bacterium]
MERLYQQKPELIVIQPFATIDTAHVNEVKKALSKHYALQVEILSAQPLPRAAQTQYIPEIARLGLGNRYRADTLLRHLKALKPKGAAYIIGLTNQDISSTKRIKGEIKQPTWLYTDWGLFGLGTRPGKSCVVSTFRLYRYTNELGMRKRLRKIAIHEIGHNIGLKHCPKSYCLMRDALEKMQTIDGAKEARRAGVRRPRWARGPRRAGRRRAGPRWLR